MNYDEDRQFKRGLTTDLRQLEKMATGTWQTGIEGWRMSPLAPLWLPANFIDCSDGLEVFDGNIIGTPYVMTEANPESTQGGLLTEEMLGKSVDALKLVPMGLLGEEPKYIDKILAKMRLMLVFLWKKKQQAKEFVYKHKISIKAKCAVCKLLKSEFRGVKRKYNKVKIAWSAMPVNIYNGTMPIAATDGEGRIFFNTYALKAIWDYDFRELSQVLRHELLHLETSLADEDPKFQALADLRGIPRSDNE